jgi:signal peptidase
MIKKIIFGSLFVLFIALFSLLIILRILGFKHYVAASSSMHPEVPKYSLVYIKKAELDELKIGDIIAYRGEGSLVLHRIIDINGDVITTKGDANEAPDRPIGYSRVIGKMVFSVPFLGILFGSPYPWLILLALIIIVYLSRELIKEIQKK